MSVVNADIIESCKLSIDAIRRFGLTEEVMLTINETGELDRLAGLRSVPFPEYRTMSSSELEYRASKYIDALTKVCQTANADCLCTVI